MTLSPERQSARMSKITHDGLTRYGHRMFYSGAHMAYGNSGRGCQRLTQLALKL